MTTPEAPEDLAAKMILEFEAGAITATHSSGAGFQIIELELATRIVRACLAGSTQPSPNLVERLEALITQWRKAADDFGINPFSDAHTLRLIANQVESALGGEHASPVIEAGVTPSPSQRTDK